MLRHALHEFEADITLTAVSPLLIRDGRVPTEGPEREKLADKRGREKMPVSIPISRASWEEVKSAITDPIDPMAKVSKLEFYIPGSSMKGCWRSHLERILRGLTPESDARVCDPLDDAGVDLEMGTTGPCTSCSKILLDKKKKYTNLKKNERFPAYAMSCPICRMFGNATLASRVTITDAKRVAPGRLIQREHVAINRKNGQVANGPFKYFALQDAKFETRITIRNYELPHILLLGALFADLAGMRIPLGSGKSKGYGQVRAEPKKLKFTAFGMESPDGPLTGVAEHPRFGKELEGDYRWTAAPGGGPPLTGWKQVEGSPWRWELVVSTTEFQDLTKQIKLRWDAVPRLDQRMAWEPGKAPAWPA